MKDPLEPDSFDRNHWEARLNLVSPGPDAKEIKCDSPKCKKKVGVAVKGGPSGCSKFVH